MSVFSDLMVEAKLAGAIDLKFAVDLTGYTGVSDEKRRWDAWARSDPTLPPHRATGRSGEEALRELVAFLKKVRE